MLEAVIGASARQFGRAIIMPNLNPPVTTVAGARAYRAAILTALERVAPGTAFDPLMTLYLTDRLAPEEVALGADEGVITAVKLYPAGATTNSDAGVTDLRNVDWVLERMQAIGMPLLIHGESTGAQVDVFDREDVFIEKSLIPLRQRFPELKIVFEHITTKSAVDYVRSTTDQHTGATITVHHLLENRNAIFAGGIRPHLYCLPILKRERDRLALLEAATSGDPRFFLGTDSAPHPRHDKETACGCAGLYTAYCAMELYAEAFDSVGKLDHLEAFASLNGPRFYGLPVNTGTLRLDREPLWVPETITAGDADLVPFRAGETLAWRVNPHP